MQKYKSEVCFDLHLGLECLFSDTLANYFVFYGPFNSIAIIFSSYKGDNKMQSATEFCLWL